MNYYIRYPENNNNVTELWSMARLPFEPTDWRQDMKKDLKKAIQTLCPKVETVLYGQYNSPDQAVCDIDNVLFYNVGTGAFKRVCQNGFFIERSYEKVAGPEEQPEKYMHYQQYALVAKTKHSGYWKEKRVLASWQDIILEKMPTKPHGYWRIMKENRIAVDTLPYSGKYGLEILLHIPNGRIWNFAGVLKPMLDGIIASLQSYQGDQLNEVSQRLATVLPYQPEEISRLLLDRHQAVLGSRALVHLFRKFVQWNPVDEQCVFIRLLRETAHGNQITMDGKIWAVEQATHERIF